MMKRHKILKKNGPNHISKYYILFLIVFISFIIRLLFRSNYLDDWDSVQFALAIKDYSIPLHQPHPPGYPIYVFFGRIVDIFINDPTKSLTFLSAFFGTISIIPVYLLAEKFFNKNVAILSSITLSLIPAHLLFSEVAMTDIVSLFFVTTTIYLLYLGIEKTKYLYLGSFILGITTGIRLTDIILMFILFIGLVYIRKLKESIVSIILIVVGISIWLIPITIDTGFNTLIDAEMSQFNYNNDTSTISESGILKAIEALITRFIDGWSYIFFIFVLITLVFVIIKILKMRFDDINIIPSIYNDKRVIFLIVWSSTYLIYSVLYNSLYISRYLLPQFAPLAIIFSYSMIYILDLNKKTKIPIAIIFAIFIILMGNQAIAGAYNISITKPAPVQATDYIKDNYDPDSTIIIPKDSSRHLRYYLPNFTFLRFEDAPDKIYDYVNKTIISEGSPVTFVPLKMFTFRRERIYPKHQDVILFEDKDIRKQFIMLEKDGWVEFGTFNNMVMRRMENSTILRLYSDDNKTININFNAVSFYRPRTIEIYNDNRKIDQKIVGTKFDNIVVSIDLKKGFNAIRFNIPEGCERDISNRCMSIAFAAKTMIRQ